MLDGSGLLKRSSAALMKLAAEDVKPLAQSFTATVGEAERVARLYKKYQPALKNVRLDARLAGAIGARVEVLKAAQAALDERVVPVRSKEEKALIAEGRALRTELVAVLEWGFRDGSLDTDVKRLREGSGVDDLIADLRELRRLASLNAKALQFQKPLVKQRRGHLSNARRPHHRPQNHAERHRRERPARSRRDLARSRCPRSA